VKVILLLFSDQVFPFTIIEAVLNFKIRIITSSLVFPFLAVKINDFSFQNTNLKLFGK